MIISTKYLAVYVPSTYSNDRWNLLQVYSDIFLEEVDILTDVVIDEPFKVMASSVCNFKDSVLEKELRDA